VVVSSDNEAGVQLSDTYEEDNFQGDVPDDSIPKPRGRYGSDYKLPKDFSELDMKNNHSRWKRHQVCYQERMLHYCATYPHDPDYHPQHSQATYEP
jgi:hypothetical protein